MALTVSKTLRGSLTVQFIDSGGPTTHYSLTGLKGDVPQINIEPKLETFEVEDGTEYENDKGWTGTFELTVAQLDDTDIQTLEDNAPGTTNDIDTIKIIFTDMGNGSDTYITITSLTDLRVGLESGQAWKMKITAKISAASDQNLHDFVVVTTP